MSRVFKIGIIEARVISKLFIVFTSINDDCRAYLKVHDEIASWLANKNGYK